jgi:hypothetical protein
MFDAYKGLQLYRDVQRNFWHSQMLSKTGAVRNIFQYGIPCEAPRDFYDGLAQVVRTPS